MWKRKTREEKEEDATGESLLKKSHVDSYESKGHVSKVIHQNSDGFPCSGIFEIGGRKWKGTILHTDRILFEHKVRGKAEPPHPKFGTSFKIDVARTDSIRMTKGNAQRIFASLIDYAFDRTRVSISEDDGGGEEEEAVAWEEADRERAMQACKNVDMESKGWECEEWLKRQAVGMVWPKVLLGCPTVQIYFLCIEGGKLLQHYPLKKLEKLSIARRRDLLAQLKRDPYSLFFEDMFRPMFPTLPELKLKTLDDDERRALGADRLLNIWLYVALQDAQQASQGTFVKTQTDSRGRITVHMPQRAFGAMRTLGELMQPLCGAILPDDCEPNFSTFNWRLCIERLENQGSIRRLTGDRMQSTKSWSATLRLFECIRRIRALQDLPPPPPPPEEKKEEDKDDDVAMEAEDGECRRLYLALSIKCHPDKCAEEWATAIFRNLHSAYESQQVHILRQMVAHDTQHGSLQNFSPQPGPTRAPKIERKQRAAPPPEQKKESAPASTQGPEPRAQGPLPPSRPLCDEQKAARDMIMKERLTLLLGPGGSGKTEVLSTLPGICELKEETALVAIKDLDKHFGAGRLKTFKDEFGKDYKGFERYFVRPHKIVFTPTGKAAKIAKERGMLAKTAHWLIHSLLHHSELMMQIMANIEIVLVDEMSMFDEVRGRCTLSPAILILLYVQVLLGQTLEALLDCAPKLQRVVLSGDWRQLPPVGLCPHCPRIHLVV